MGENLTMSKVYIAGPLFTSAERDILEQISTMCEGFGYKTYLPHRDAGLFKRGDNSSKLYFIADLEQIEACSLIVAVLNGLDVDSGTCWEMGYAFSKNKPIIGYVDDIRIYEPQNQLNPMIFNSLTTLASTLDQLSASLKKHTE